MVNGANFRPVTENVHLDVVDIWIWNDEDIHDLRSVETEFPAIAFNDEVSSKTLSYEPTVSSLNDKIDFRVSFDDSDDEDYTEFDLKNKTSLSGYDEEEQSVLYFNDLFPFNIIRLDDLKLENDNDDNDIDIIQSSEDMAPLPPREQRHPFLRYQGLEYIDADIADFEERMVMEHRDDAGVVVFTTQAWGGCEARRRLTWRMILGKGDLHGYWRGIYTDGDFLGPPPSYTLIRDLMLRLCHRMMEHSIAGRSQTPEKVTVTDLFYLRGLDVRLVNIPYLLARYLRRFAARRKSGAHISRGQFVAHLAEHFGLLTAEILAGLTVIAPELPIIGMAELVRLQIYEQLDDTWAWVTIGLERQPDAAVGAPEVAQDALIINEGGHADPTPAQAPPPPPAAARTMPQRMARLEEDVHEIHGTLAEHHEVINMMACDFSRFCTWTTTSLAWMMDRAGVTYTSYYETPREYTRPVSRRTGEASTSAA
ncbi:hypothetical protein Tco_0299376 [Tanacetum coccineum]